jgi:hypothetical protein
MSYSYMAPEVMELVSGNGRWAKGYTYMADYWSLGVLAYVMIAGTFPFRLHKGKEAVEKDIRDRKNDQIEFSDTASIDYIDFICYLLDANEHHRLGYGINGLQDIKNHPFYLNCDTFDWTDVMKKGCRPPVVPSEVRDCSPAAVSKVPKYESFEDVPLTAPNGKPFATPNGWDQESFKDW